MSMLPPLSGRIRNGLASLSASVLQLTSTAYRTFYADSAGNVQALAHGAAGTVLKSNGAAADPSWGTIAPTDTSIVGAGTWKVLYVNGTNAVIELSLGADGKYLRSGGAAAAPTFAAIAPTELLGTAFRTVYNDSAGLMKELAHGTSGYALVSNGANADPSWKLVAGGMLKTSSTGTFGIPTQPANLKVVTSGASNVYGSYVQLLASTSAAIFISHLVIKIPSSTNNVSIIIATGAAGVETDVGQILVGNITISATDVITYVIPLTMFIPVAISTRIAAKSADNAGTLGHLVGLIAVNQSDVSAI